MVEDTFSQEQLKSILEGIRKDPRKPKKVVAAMSGGVDSSVAAWLMRESGIEVIGVTLRLRPCDEDQQEQRKACCGAEDSIHAKATAGRIGISHYFLDFQDEFRHRVLEVSWNEYSKGRTPNPCVLCNRFLKFGKLYQYACEMGAEGIVTGHYARVKRLSSGEMGLFRGVDTLKDQSYFLFALDGEVISRCYFPLGELTKKEVRQLAKRIGLTNAEKKESQDACFGVPGEAFADTLRRVLGKNTTPGYFIDPEGRVLGPHRGVHHYTLGQRRGLGIALGKRAYVARIDPATGTIVLSTEEDTIKQAGLEATDVNWLDPSKQKEPFMGLVQVRYTQKPVAALILPLSVDRIQVQFQEPVRAITPGQAAVVYQGDRVICGGWIC
ncbi:MAG: tRNA 2-thiouridine(34) synthase MnmA [Spirochaetes bacterium]|nr:tRNA 2-thiouridine(34) synthase MnmA [Spirochaetota bacterium]